MPHPHAKSITGSIDDSRRRVSYAAESFSPIQESISAADRDVAAASGLDLLEQIRVKAAAEPNRISMCRVMSMIVLSEFSQVTMHAVRPPAVHSRPRRGSSAPTRQPLHPQQRSVAHRATLRHDGQTFQHNRGKTVMSEAISHCPAICGDPPSRSY